MKIRITILLMVAIGGLVALSVSAVLFVSSSATIKNTFELLNRRAALTVTLVEQSVNAYVSPTKDMLVHIRQLVEEGSLDINDSDQVFTTLRAAFAAAPQITSIVFLHPNAQGSYTRRGPNGTIQSTNTPQLPPDETKDIVKVARENGQIMWGDPNDVDGNSVMTIAGPIYSNDKFVGVVAAGISLRHLSDHLDETIANDKMTGFVLYGDDSVLAHPALNKPGVRALVSKSDPLPNVSQIGDPVLAALKGLEASETPERANYKLYEYDEGNVSELILTRTINSFGNVPWTVGVHTPADAAGRQIRRLFGSIGIGIGLLALSIAAGLLLASRIARPIRSISDAAGKIATLDIGSIKSVPPSRISELDDQSRAFNKMVVGLKWFETYVPQQLVTRLMNAGDDTVVDHREAELTVMFTDIIGFTPMSEALPPAEVAKFLNEHFDAVNNCIEAENGTLDKYIGDAAMAFWGAPEAVPDHAARACRTALALLKASEDHQAKGLQPPIRMKIALHTGPLIVGNIGAKARMNYTIIGDTVNTASRIEKLCGEADDGSAAIIVVSGETAKAAGKGFNFEFLGSHTVKGRSEKIEIWRLRP